MRKILFLSLALLFALVSLAQKRGSLVTKEQKEVQKTLVYNPIKIHDLGNLENTGNATVGNYFDLEGWDIIGHTWYDVQTNTGLDNRICSFSDGTMAAVYTFGPEGENPNFDGRGAGYNYFDGSSWRPIPTERIETDRCGWPTIAPLGENGEIVVSHYAGADVDGLAINTRPNKGSGDWTEVWFEAINSMVAAFPRVITNGENNNNIHMLYSFNNTEYLGMEDPAFYNRSLDGGLTWDIQHEILEGMTPEDYSAIGGDNVVWANPIGNTIAFAFASAWETDLVVMKSVNNGEDWDKTIVWEHPYPFYDWDATIMTDTMWAPDGGVSIALDASGKVHLVATLCRVLHDELGNNYTGWQYGEGVIYWNEDRPIFEANNQHDALNAWDPEILEPDVELIGWGQDMDNDDLFTLYNDDLFTYAFTIGASTMPAIACDDNNGIMIAWSGISEVDVYNDEYNFRRIWTRGSPDNGESWTDHKNINLDITMSFDECIWPVLNKSMNGEYHLVYQADYDIGTALDGDHEYLKNRITYYHDNVPYISGVNFDSQNQVSVSQNYPNPATTTTQVNIELPASGAMLSLEVIDIMGKVIYTENRGKVKSLQSTFVIDVSDYTPGVYFYAINLNDKVFTHKMLVE